MKKKIIIIGGDPQSINSEIIFKTWKKISLQNRKNIFLVCNFDLLNKQFKALGYKIKLKKVNSLLDNDSDKLKIIDVNLKFKNCFKIPFKNSSTYVKTSLNIAHKLGLKKEVKAIINCPIDKRLLSLAGKNGVTEYLAKKCNIKNSEAMLISNLKYSVVPLTTHYDLKEVSKKLKVNYIINKIVTINKFFKKYFKKKPKISILGLNPHNAELRRNSEEVNKIIPAIKKLKNKGIKISGPFAADTIFIKNYRNFDVVAGMYHDQVLAPFKSLFNYEAINITLGLKYIRVSPDHGTATDIIMKKKANPLSLIKCIYFVNKLK